MSLCSGEERILYHVSRLQRLLMSSQAEPPSCSRALQSPHHVFSEECSKGHGGGGSVNHLTSAGGGWGSGQSHSLLTCLHSCLATGRGQHTIRTHMVLVNLLVLLSTVIPHVLAAFVVRTPPCPVLGVSFSVTITEWFTAPPCAPPVS